MSNQWFRMYAEFANDPKVQMMSEAYQRRFVMLLCIRCSNDDVTLQDEEVAFQLRISNEEWAETKGAFLAKDLINEDNTPTAWDKRQYRSDSSAERVRKHREKKQQACNVTVTAPDTESDTDTEADKNKNKASPKAPRFDAQAHLVSLGVDVGVAADWLSLRKTKKAPATETAINGVLREAAKARLSLPAALEIACQRGWAGFKADWVTNQPAQASQRVSHSDQTKLAAARAIFGTEIEGENHGQSARIIDVTPTLARIVGG